MGIAAILLLFLTFQQLHAGGACVNFWGACVTPVAGLRAAYRFLLKGRAAIEQQQRHTGKWSLD
jgi:hypothetical protein